MTETLLETNTNQEEPESLPAPRKVISILKGVVAIVEGGQSTPIDGYVVPKNNGGRPAIKVKDHRGESTTRELPIVVKTIEGKGKEARVGHLLVQAVLEGDKPLLTSIEFREPAGIADSLIRPPLKT
jgi:hypothetical protein